MEDYMKILNFIAILAICFFSFVSCGGDETEGDGNSESGTPCESNLDCPNIGDKCDLEKKICTNPSQSKGGSGEDDGDNGGNSGGEDGDSEGDGQPGKQDGDDDPITGRCEPGKKQTCEYEGPAGTENNYPCRAAIRTCDENGKWGPCEGEVLPVYEAGVLCNNEIDDDCNGVVNDGTDADGDGVGACSDCCESTEQCPDPKSAWNANDPSHACKYEAIDNNCDSGLAPGSVDPYDYAKAIGICETATADSANWGLIEAKITAPDGSLAVHDNSSGLVSAFGNVIKPKSGNYMLALTSGKIKNNKFTAYDPGSSGITSGAPKDWFEEAHGKQFPSAASCPKSGTSGKVNDAVMLEMKIKTPKTAKSFSFNIYFLTQEYFSFVCSSFNDFFIALLDSEYESDNENLQNPDDKNLAMDEKGNPVGVNLAPGGLFTQCVNNSKTVGGELVEVTSCVGTEDLQGTNGFEGHGGTGWLTTRGNIKGGEIITLRLAIWDLEDHYLDSLVLIDNFKWDATAQKPGTGL